MSLLQTIIELDNPHFIYLKVVFSKNLHFLISYFLFTDGSSIRGTLFIGGSRVASLIKKSSFGHLVF